MAQQDYFVGFDIGTDSVGWAVTDPQYKIIKRNGKALWGVRLFDSARTAAECRGYRIARRRLERQHQRIAWLQEQFSEAIGTVDPAFFQRLKESKFLEEDKRQDYSLGRYTLFADKDFCDRDYHREFPTIYHLRRALLSGQHTWSKPSGLSLYDPRLVYLAVHHILKYRGHFLFGGLSMDAISLESGLERLNDALDSILGETLEAGKSAALAPILTDRKRNKRLRKKQMAELFGISKENPALNALLDLLAGSKVSLDALFHEPVSNEDIQKFSLEDAFEEKEASLTAALGDRLELILAAKEIYDWARLENMRDGEQYLSQAKVKSYERHRRDLEQLKKLIRSTGDKALYREIFREAGDNLDNYPAYAGTKGSAHRCDYDAFSKYLTRKLRSLPGSAETTEILQKLEQKCFLPKQTTKDNGVIPHQLHEAELAKILDNAAQYLPFLSEIDESGLPKRRQIMEMFRFRVPYYVGPLSPRSSHGWVVRADDKIYPWNFENVVDLEKCAERFITRMTAKCSYIGEDVLPKDSLLYSKFMVLNELNNLCINGRRIPVALKQQIYNTVFLSGRKVTQESLQNHLRSNGYMKADKKDEPDDVLSGFDGDFKATLAPWRAFSWLLPRPGGEEAAEEIIRHIVLFSDDKKLLKNWLAKTYDTLLSPQEQEAVLRYRFSGWGRLSRNFLTGIYHTDPETGEAFSIMDLLWAKNENLNELLSSRYTFGQAVENYRRAKLAGSSVSLDDYLKDSYASPAIKRAIHQTIRITGELQKIMKGPPKRIFLEMAREEGIKGKRTVSRKAQLTELYQKCGEESNTLFAHLELSSDGELRRDKLYLYYTQLGKCMYSGEPIDLDRLNSGYDIDHIYPQSKTKDDSLDNRVLVKRELNAAKGDTYPIGKPIRDRMHSFWKMLKDRRFISAEKYNRLVRTNGFSSDDLAGFINRQLVETRQSSKIIAELLQRRFGGSTEIVYVKAGNVSSFRQDQRLMADGTQRQAGQCRKHENTTQDPLFVKCREVNNFHHAKDAYLNIVVGNVYHLKFTRSPANYLKEKDPVYSLNRMFDFDVIRHGEQGWKAGAGGSIDTVRHYMGKNNILFTRLPLEQKGGLFDRQIVAKGKAQAQIKGSDPRMAPDRYGGYNKRAGAYFFLVEHTVKKKRSRSLETVFLMHKSMYEADPVAYCQEILGLHDPKILIPRIKINSLVSFDGFRMHISGRTGDHIIFKNANQLVVSPVWQQYIKQVSKYLERCKNAGRDLKITKFDGLTEAQNCELYQILLEKLRNPLYRTKYDTAAKSIAQQQERFQALEIPDQCRVLMQVLNLFANNAASADLKLAGGKAGIGILKISKKLDNYQNHHVKLIHPSVTGVFEREIDLLSEELT